jgi:hypothetical protein
VAGPAERAESLTERWRRADEPAAAHDVALALLDARAYARTRGVAQQAARLARARRLERAGRRRLLATAWLHDVGASLGAGLPGLEAGRALRRAGHEPVARLVAHAGFSDLAAALAGLPPVVREFPLPSPPDDDLLLLLDVAVVTTAGDGTRATPAAALRDLAQAAGRGSLAVRVRVALIARLGDDADARRLAERVAAPGI